ncbi:MAG: hydantoinase/carbamoylase family amidase [Rhizobiaceae bacterium]
MRPLPHDQAVEAALSLARALFDTIGSRTFDGVGFTRAAYGEGEQIAHDIVAGAARELDLAVEVDAVLNLSMTLRGEDPGLKPLVIGSHLDAVPQGGNFDGLAGVLAGLACLAAYRAADLRPPRDIVLMAIRAEESAWFGAQHIGSRALLGTLDARVLHESRRVDTGLTLFEHMKQAGADMQRIGTAAPLIDPRALRGYIELHIEQGPLLVSRDLPVGVVTGIRGNRRCRRLSCLGRYAHSGTEPRALRHDAVFSVSELVTRIDALWRMIEEEEGGDLVATFGRFTTNPAAHAVTTVPGEVEFSFDARSHSSRTLARVEAALNDAMAEIAARRGVTFSHDAFTGDDPAPMDPAFRELLLEGCRKLSIPATPLPSGAGHDAGDFSAAGVPSAMIFVRNDKGSHNPEEAMEFGDFALGARLMLWFVANLED